MPNNNFNGKTFVAFVDISGFKNRMQNKKAGEALMEFYSIGYRILNTSQNITGVFISDCGILYHHNVKISILDKLKEMFEIIKSINEKMLEKNYLLTTSIAYGDFEYRNKIELENMTKNSFQGYAYLDAYLDNEQGAPKLQAGECRLLISDDFRDIDLSSLVNLKKTSKHYYYYWMIHNHNSIGNYEKSIKIHESKFIKKSKKITDEKFEDLKELMKGQN